MDTRTKSSVLLEYLPIFITFVVIVVFAIIFKQKVIKTLPLCISLVIMLLNARANRIGFLIGALNTLIYVIGYISEGLYGTVVSALFGGAVQLATFFRWKQHAYKKATKFRRFTKREAIITLLAILLCWATISVVLWKINGTEYVLDGFTTTLGFALPVLTMFAFVESPFINIISQSVSLTIWIRIIISTGNIANLTYIIYLIYCIYMVSRQGASYIKLYKEQQENK